MKRPIPSPRVPGEGRGDAPGLPDERAAFGLLHLAAQLRTGSGRLDSLTPPRAVPRSSSASLPPSSGSLRADRRFRPLIEARVQRELYEVLLRWMEGSRPKAGGREASPEATASVASWAIFGAALDWSRNGAGPSSSARVAEETLSVLLEGLRL